MSTFEGRVDDVSRQFDEKCRQLKNDRKTSEWNLKVEVETKIDKFMAEVQTTNEKVNFFSNLKSCIKYDSFGKFTLETPSVKLSYYSRCCLMGSQIMLPIS